MATKQTPPQQSQPRKRIRRGKLAEHFGVHVRTVDLWSKKGTLPAPHYLSGSKIPFWFEDQIPDLNLKAAS